MSGLTTRSALPSADSACERLRALFARTMWLIALTAATSSAGAYLGRNLPGALGIATFVAAFACLLGMNVAVTRSTDGTPALLAGFGLLTGLALAPTLAYYASVDPPAFWLAGAATGLFVAGFGPSGTPRAVNSPG